MQRESGADDGDGRELNEKKSRRARKGDVEVDAKEVDNVIVQDNAILLLGDGTTTLSTANSPEGKRINRGDRIRLIYYIAGKTTKIFAGVWQKKEQKKAGKGYKLVGKDDESRGMLAVKMARTPNARASLLADFDNNTLFMSRPHSAGSTLPIHCYASTMIDNTGRGADWVDEQHAILVMVSRAPLHKPLAEVVLSPHTSRDRQFKSSKNLYNCVTHIHAGKIIHRDIKAENAVVLVDNEGLETNDVRLIDFATAVEFRAMEATSDLVGTFLYMSLSTITMWVEEVIIKPVLENPHFKAIWSEEQAEWLRTNIRAYRLRYISPEVDLWSLGIVLLEILVPGWVYETMANSARFEALQAALPANGEEVQSPAEVEKLFEDLARGFSKLIHEPRAYKLETSIDPMWYPLLDALFMPANGRGESPDLYGFSLLE